MTNQRAIVARICGMRAMELLQLILNTGSKLQSKSMAYCGITLMWSCPDSVDG
jgi:hypothetical protein